MSIFERVSKVLTELAGPPITPESSLLEDLALDSLHMVILLMEIEDEFGITLDESDMNPYHLITVKNVVELVEKYCGDANEKDC